MWTAEWAGRHCPRGRRAAEPREGTQGRACPGSRGGMWSVAAGDQGRGWRRAEPRDSRQRTCPPGAPIPAPQTPSPAPAPPVTQWSGEGTVASLRRQAGLRSLPCRPRWSRRTPVTSVGAA